MLTTSSKMLPNVPYTADFLNPETTGLLFSGCHFIFYSAHYECYIFKFNWPTVYSGLRILMVWCFSPKTSVSTVLRMRLFVFNCLWGYHNKFMCLTQGKSHTILSQLCNTFEILPITALQPEIIHFIDNVISKTFHSFNSFYVIRKRTEKCISNYGLLFA